MNMKKHAKRIAALVSALTLVAGLAVGVYAVEPTLEAGHWVVNAPKNDEILAGEAGEASVAFEVPFLSVEPTIDGKISKGEYQPFELYEDYMSYMAFADNGTEGSTQEEFQEFYNMASQGFFDAYWGWDGRYLYLALEVRCLNGFACTPEPGGNAYLYKYNILQIGLAPSDIASGADSRYVELGYGVHSETGESLTHTWRGPFWSAEEDFKGTYDAENQVVVYETRINLQQALQMDRTVENGDTMNFAWLLGVNGQAEHVNDYWQVAFCHGIGGQYSHKCPQYFAQIEFTGKDITIPPEELPGVSEEDLEYGLKEAVDMSDEKTVQTFTGENASIEYITEGEESFARITAVGQNPYVWSSKYPRNLASEDCGYVVVKYRATGENPSEMGILYRNANYKEYDLEYTYTEQIGNDGEWHTAIFYMEGEESWVRFITNIGLAPFYGEEALGRSIDISFIKFYSEDPYELYEASLFDPDAGNEETSEEPTEQPTEVPTEQSSEPAESTTQAPATEEVTEAPKESGCGSVIGFGAVAVLTAAVAAVALKKKEN